ncbi:MAG: hypothetical protein JOZ58_27000, partial [Acetobacteraceae bacterium]|nr:hypothetical protein [Acetobacteraceae bacterium]
ALKDAGDHYEYVGSARAVTIPATLRDSLMARLDRFTPVREIAQIGAAIGRDFSYEMIEAVAPMPQAQLDDALARLCASGLAFRRGTPPDAIYTFKHALVQDAAYDSLLRRRRQELHAKIARVIEQRFPNIQATEPEVLAHHLTEAGRIEAAIPLWQAAGELALKRVASAEAIAHLDRGLDLISTLPQSSQRDTDELRLRGLLGTAWTGHKGWPAPEVWNSLHPALALAKSLKRYDALPGIMDVLNSNILSQGRTTEALLSAEETLDLAKAIGDTDLRISGHWSACGDCFWAGKLSEVLEHADMVLDLYDIEKHNYLTDVTYLDPRNSSACFASTATWLLGYPDRAVRLNHEKDTHARRRGHPFDLGFALYTGAHEFDERWPFEDLLKRAEECERLGRENSLPVLWANWAPTLYGKALILKGRPAEGIAPLKAGMAWWVAAGGRVGNPTRGAFLAEGMALIGDLDGALSLLDEALEQIERPGWGNAFTTPRSCA